MNLEELYNRAVKSLEVARSSLVALVDGMKDTKSNDYSSVMAVATDVAKAEESLSKLKDDWKKQAESLRQEFILRKEMFICEQRLWDDVPLSEDELQEAITFDFSKYIDEVE